MHLFGRMRHHRQPVSPLTVVGHGRIFNAHLSPGGRRRLLELAGRTTEQWGVLLIVDGRARRWTLYSPDVDHVEMFAPVAHVLTVQPEVFVTKFLAWNAGWTVD